MLQSLRGLKKPTINYSRFLSPYKSGLFKTARGSSLIREVNLQDASISYFYLEGLMRCPVVGLAGGTVFSCYFCSMSMVFSILTGWKLSCIRFEPGWIVNLILGLLGFMHSKIQMQEWIGSMSLAWKLFCRMFHHSYLKLTFAKGIFSFLPKCEFEEVRARRG